MYVFNSSIDFPITHYYFRTFVVGSYSSVPHLIRDLLSMKEIANKSISLESLPSRNEELKKLITMIDNELSKYDIENELSELEESEPIYWVNRLGRQSALEISTYGRIRPETMNLLMCLPEDEFIAAMSIAGRLSTKVQVLGETSLSQRTPVPSTMPIIS
jgi:hypothetical protein